MKRSLALVMMMAASSAFAFKHTAPVRKPSSEARLVNELICRSTTTMALMDIRAEVGEHGELTNFHLWNYGEGESIDLMKSKTTQMKKLDDASKLFKKYADMADQEYGVHGKRMTGKVVQFSLEHGNDFVIRPGYEKESTTDRNHEEFEASLLETDRDSPVNFHSFMCWVSPGYTDEAKQ